MVSSPLSGGGGVSSARGRVVGGRKGAKVGREQFGPGRGGDITRGCPHFKSGFCTSV